MLSCAESRTGGLLDDDHGAAEGARVIAEVDRQGEECDGRDELQCLDGKPELLDDPDAGPEQYGVGLTVERFATPTDRVVVDPHASDVALDEPAGPLRTEEGG